METHLCCWLPITASFLTNNKERRSVPFSTQPKGVVFLLALAPTRTAAEARGAHVVGAHAYLAQPLDLALILLPQVIDELARLRARRHVASTEHLHAPFHFFMTPPKLQFFVSPSA
jgi:hypothetical protein